MRAFYTDRFVLPLPAGHRFPMEKYRRLRDRIVAELPGISLAEPAAATDGQLALAHAPGYIESVSSGTLSPEIQRAIGFPWSPEMVERSRRSVGATIAACRAACAGDRGVKVSANLAGGTHHAFKDRVEGFCVFNDAAVAARLMQAEGFVRRVAIVDLDVHQGNGTAAILAGDDSIFTLSLHGERNFPFTKTESDLDIALPDGTGDAAYLEALTRGLEAALVGFAPDLVIYLAGADPHEGDRLGRLTLTHGGLAARDRMVLHACRSRDVPVAIAMAGGYGRNMDDTVSVHFSTLRTALEMAGA